MRLTKEVLKYKHLYDSSYKPFQQTYEIMADMLDASLDPVSKARWFPHSSDLRGLLPFLDLCL